MRRRAPANAEDADGDEEDAMPGAEEAEVDETELAIRRMTSPASRIVLEKDSEGYNIGAAKLQPLKCAGYSNQTRVDRQEHNCVTPMEVEEPLKNCMASASMHFLPRDSKWINKSGVEEVPMMSFMQEMLAPVMPPMVKQLGHLLECINNHHSLNGCIVPTQNTSVVCCAKGSVKSMTMSDDMHPVYQEMRERIFEAGQTPQKSKECLASHGEFSVSSDILMQASNQPIHFVHLEGCIVCIVCMVCRTMWKLNPQPLDRQWRSRGGMFLCRRFFSCCSSSR